MSGFICYGDYSNTGVGLLVSELGKQLKELTEREHELLRILTRAVSLRKGTARAMHESDKPREDPGPDPSPPPPEKDES